MDTDQREAVIDAAVRPLGDNAELRMSAANYLKSRINNGSGNGSELIHRWERADKANRRISSRFIFAMVVLAVSVWTIWTVYPDVSRMFLVWTDPFRIGQNLEDDAETRISEKLTVEENRIFFGDLSQSNPVGRKRALWQSEPDNPAFYVEYAATLLGEEKKLPTDFLETARRTDPENSWFTFFAAAAETIGSVERKAPRHTRSAGKIISSDPPSWEIKDAARLDKAIEIFNSSSGQSTHESYFNEMLQRRLAMIPRRTVLEMEDSLICLNANQRFPSFSMRNLTDAIAAKAWLAKNEEDLRIAISAGEKFLITTLGTEPGVVIDEMLHGANASRLAENFAASADNLGLKEMSARWGRIEADLKEPSKERYTRELLIDGQPVAEGLKTGYLVRAGLLEVLLQRTATQIPLSDRDIAPGRYYDHEALGFLACLASFLVLWAVILFPAIYRLRATKAVNRLAARMEQALGASDWIWILGGGIVAPLVYVVSIIRFTPWGGREYGILGGLLLLPASQFLALILLWVILPVMIIRWRLSARLELLGFSHGHMWIPGIVICSLLLFVPWVGWAAIAGTIPQWWVDHLDFPPIGVQWREPWEAPLWSAAAILAAPVLWLTFNVSASLLTGTGKLLQRATTARILVVAYGFAILAALGAVPVFKSAQQYWFAQDYLVKFDSRYPSWSRLEYQIAVQSRKELTEILEIDTWQPDGTSAIDSGE